MRVDVWKLGGVVDATFSLVISATTRTLISSTNRPTFYHALLRRARYCYGKSSVRPSFRDVEIPWSHRLEIFENNFTVSYLGCSLSADPNITDLLQRKHPEILAGIREGIEKAAFGVYFKALISLKRGKIGLRLLSNPIQSVYYQARGP